MVILSTPNEVIGTFDTEGEALMHATLNGISPFSITTME